MRKISTSLTGLLLLLTSTLLPAAGPQLQYATDLAQDAVQARQKQVPILVLFSSSYCGYCTIIREDFLKPMLKNAEYNNKVIIRVVSIDSGSDLRDFDGGMIDPDTLAHMHNVFVTPTVKLFGPNGETLVPDLVGLTTVDYYGGYLDAAIDESLAQLRSDNKLALNP
ncbi:MAG: thioredoxin family protein [Granulosicoccaceae bacterium]|jgi:thioredoxin-related protein